MIKVQCWSPKRLKGEHKFASFEDFALWVIANIRGGKPRVGGMLRTLAEKGELITTSIGCDIHATSEFSVRNYFDLRELERRTKVIKKKGLDDVTNKNPDAAINFARELDKLAQK